jgi:hypothetical protein
MGGRAGAASLSGGEIYFDVLASSYRAVSGAGGAYPTPEEQVEFFAHEIHHVGLSRTLERQRRALRLDPAENRGLDFLTSLVMEGSATYLINAHRDLAAMRKDPLYADFLARGDDLLATCQEILLDILKGSLDAEGYDRATAPLSGNGWHSAGAMMLAAIDADGGLDAVTAVLRNPRALLGTYDRAVSARRGSGAWTFDPELAARVARLGTGSYSPGGDKPLPYSRRPPESATTTATKRAAPMTDQRNGNAGPSPRRIRKSSGSLALRAIQEPSSAPMKPSTIETMQPPRDPPAIARPIPPANAAITR